MARPRGFLARLWRLSWRTLAVLAALAAALQVWFFAHIVYWNFVNPSSTAFMSRYLETPGARVRHIWVAYERISPHLKRAVVAAEDAKFLEHEGFDWEAIQQAMAKNERRGRVVAGASTITQQLAKNLFLSSRRSWLRKAQEAIITGMMELVMSKRRILELYLNFAEWGEGVFGAEAAARYHFGTSAAALSPGQAAWLAAILPSPRRYARGRTTAYLESRSDTILVRMGGAHIP